MPRRRPQSPSVTDSRGRKYRASDVRLTIGGQEIRAPISFEIEEGRGGDIEIAPSGAPSTLPSVNELTRAAGRMFGRNLTRAWTPGVGFSEAIPRPPGIELVADPNIPPGTAYLLNGHHRAAAVAMAIGQNERIDPAAVLRTIADAGAIVLPPGVDVARLEPPPGMYAAVARTDGEQAPLTLESLERVQREIFERSDAREEPAPRPYSEYGRTLRLTEEDLRDDPRFLEAAMTSMQPAIDRIYDNMTRALFGAPNDTQESTEAAVPTTRFSRLRLAAETPPLTTRRLTHQVEATAQRNSTAPVALYTAAANSQTETITSWSLHFDGLCA